jgi:hypothetical protein
MGGSYCVFCCDGVDTTVLFNQVSVLSLMALKFEVFWLWLLARFRTLKACWV